jgi:hypothetical protein
LCENPVSIDVPDGTTYTVDFGGASVCYETTSELVTGDCTPAARLLTVNGVEQKCNQQDWTLPTQRHHGYCIQTDAGPPNSLLMHLH